MKPALSFVALLLLAACGKTQAPPPAASSQPPAASSDQASIPAPPPSSNAPVAQPSGSPDMDAAQAVVAALYKPELTPFPARPAKDPFFTPEFAKAMKASTHPGEVGAIDFDYRYGAQDVQITDLNFGPAMATPVGAHEAVRFQNIGKPYEVDFDLVRTPNGWRIAEVSAPAQQGDQAWSLRADLKLKPLGS